MGFIQFMTRQEVIEKYSIPPELESEIFSVLRPAHGSGVNARYLEGLVDKQLTRHFEQKDRLWMKDAWSYPNKEDLNVIDAAGTMEPMERIAYGIERLIEVLVPTAQELVGTRYIASKLGKTPQWIGKMADRGDIPKSCIVPRASGGRIRKFYRDKIDAWLDGHR